MSRDDRLNVILFALTGFGNPVMEALLKDTRVNLEAVLTVKYDHPYPYYEERQLIEICSERGVICYHGVNVSSNEGIRLLEKHAPDLIIMATFKQILKENVLNLPSLGVINIHPSLLPYYRGPCPTNAALLNGEKITGLTVHYATKELDEGNILLQKSLIIEETDIDGELRQKLAKLAGKMIPDLIGIFAGYAHPVGTPQDHSLASHAPKPTTEDGYLERVKDVETIRKMVRAFNPLPGTSILVGDKRISVDRSELFQDSGPDRCQESNEAIDLIINSQAIRLYKKLI